MRALLSWSLLLLLLPAGCGSGAIAAGIAGGKNRNGAPPPTRNPSLTVDRPEGPLFAAADVVLARTVFVNFVRIASGSKIAVQLRGLGEVSAQGGPLLLTAEDQGSRIGFLLRSDEIRARIPDPTAADVPVQLAVVVDGKDIAPPVPFLLLAQPKAELVPPTGQSRAFLSVQGGSKLTLRVRGLKATSVTDLRMQIGTPDPITGQLNAALATNLQLTDEPSTGAKLLTGTAPALAHPTRALAAVSDSRAGQSTVVFDLFYLPELEAMTPRFAGTDGGEPVALFGAGLVPYDFTQNPPPLDFNKVTILVEKGGRQVVVPPQALRREQSSLTRLLFPLPASPDGLPGPADLILRVQLDTYLAEVREAALLRYGFSQPMFGPRGVALPGPATQLAIGPMPGDAGVPDLATVEASGQAGVVRLFAANGGGSWNRLGAGIATGAGGDPRAQAPVALLAGDADRDSLSDLVAVHAGGASGAAHGILLAQARPKPPLARSAVTIPDQDGARHALGADVDLDGLPDLLVLPDPAAASPGARLFLARPSGPGAPAFVPASLPTNRAQDAAHCSDLDGDGKPDLALARGGASPRIEVLFGDGQGGFTLGPSFALTVPGYTADPASRVVGIHATGTARALTVVFAGLPSSSASPPCVAMLPPGTQPRTWDPPLAANVLLFAGHDEPFVASVLRDLDADGTDELLVGAGGKPAQALRLLQRTMPGWRELTGAIEAGDEAMLDLQALEIDVVVPADGRVILQPVLGVQVMHRVEVDGLPEDRISTLLVGAGPSLQPPDAGATRPKPLLAIAAGDFRARGAIGSRGGRADDLWLLDADGLRRMHNDGAARFAAGPAVVQQPIPGSLAAVPFASHPGDSLAFLRADGRLGVILPGTDTALLVQRDLRLLAPEPIRGRPLGARSRLTGGDVDGDGNPDLVAWLELADPQEAKEGEGILVLLRGKATAGPAELPVHEPDASVVVPTCHGSTTGIALGDFVHTPSAAGRSELAVAVPRGESSAPQHGNHVRFFRYVEGADPTRDTLVRSFADPALPVLLAGDGPVQLAAADFDQNGTTDLGVASAGDRHLRWFLNTGAVSTSAPLEVAIVAFQEGLGASVPLPAGTPLQVGVVDATGAGAPGMVVVSEDRAPVPDTAVLCALGSGEGQIVQTFVAAQSRTGNRDATGQLRGVPAQVAVADFDADGRLDLAIAWESAGAGDRNVRVLFAGSR